MRMREKIFYTKLYFDNDLWSKNLIQGHCKNSTQGTLCENYAKLGQVERKYALDKWCKKDNWQTDEPTDWSQ